MLPLKKGFDLPNVCLLTWLIKGHNVPYVFFSRMFDMSTSDRCLHYFDLNLDLSCFYFLYFTLHFYITCIWTTKALSTWTQVFSKLKNTVSGYWNRNFLKNPASVKIFQNFRYSVVVWTRVLAPWHQLFVRYFLLSYWPTWLGSLQTWKTWMRQILHIHSKWIAYSTVIHFCTHVRIDLNGVY